MISYKIELNNHPIKGTDEYKLMLRITYQHEHARITLDYAIKKNQYNPNPKQNRYVKQNHHRHESINVYLDEKIQKAKVATNALNNEGKLVSAKSVKQRLLIPKSRSFYDYADLIIQQLKRNNNIGNYKKYKSLIEKLKKYTKNEDLTFQELDVKFLKDFQSHILSEGNVQSTIHGNLKTIRAILYRAIDEGIMEQSKNPFFSFKMMLGKINKERLNEEEIKTIEALKLPEGKLIWHVRNAFMFAFYTAGMRASDIIMLKWANIQTDRLIYQMHKTGKVHSLKLTDQAKKILLYYGPKEPDKYIFPFFSPDVNYNDPMFLYNQLSAKTALINKYLKTIATKAEINKKISTHTARHSFADIARKKTNNLYNLSKTLGHSNLKTTENYIASFDEEAVDKTLDDIFK